MLLQELEVADIALRDPQLIAAGREQIPALALAGKQGHERQPAEHALDRAMVDMFTRNPVRQGASPLPAPPVRTIGAPAIRAKSNRSSAVLLINRGRVGEQSLGRQRLQLRARGDRVPGAPLIVAHASGEMHHPAT